MENIKDYRIKIVTGQYQKAPLEQKKMTVKVSPKKVETMKYEICDQMAAQVVADAVRSMRAWGVLLPEDIKIVFCDDVNCHMCQVENLCE